MTKKTKKKVMGFLNNNKFLVVALVGLLVVGSSVSALTLGGTPQNSTESGDINVTNNNYTKPYTQSGMLGSAEMPDCDNAGHITGCPSTYGNVFAEGALEVDGLVYADAGITISGADARVASLIKTGAIATFTVTSTATAANVCDNPLWTVTPATSTPTITMPTTSTLFADCLTTNGDTISFNVKTITTSTIMAVGTGGNLDLDATATITADKSARVTVIRDSATSYLMQIDNFNS